MKCFRNALIVAAGLCSTSVLQAQATGTLNWNGFCSPGVFIVDGLDCGTSACSLKMQRNDVTTNVANLAATSPMIGYPVQAGTSTFWVEINGVVSTNVVSIENPTNCLNQ